MITISIITKYRLKRSSSRILHWVHWSQDQPSWLIWRSILHQSQRIRFKTSLIGSSISLKKRLFNNMKSSSLTYSMKINWRLSSTLFVHWVMSLMFPSMVILHSPQSSPWRVDGSFSFKSGFTDPMKHRGFVNSLHGFLLRWGHHTTKHAIESRKSKIGYPCGSSGGLLNFTQLKIQKSVTEL